MVFVTLLLYHWTEFLFAYECRDGVSESQFNQVLNIELSQIIEVFKILKFSFNIWIVNIK
jgi:hypothetical protein